jgi:transposase-like protein
VARAHLIITAVVVEGRSKTEVARNYGVSRYWVQQYQREGPSAFLPRSRRPHHKVGRRDSNPRPKDYETFPGPSHKIISRT